MKKFKFVIILVLFVTGISKAQIDTTDWFPLQAGNYWEYMAFTGEGPKYFSQKVVGDTLMANGKHYKIISEEYFSPYSQDFLYFRQESNKVYKYVGVSIPFPTGDYKYLDFIVPDSTIWIICPSDICIDKNARGIATTFYDDNYFNYLQRPIEAKQFEDVYVDSADTIWTPGDGSFPIVLNRGFGIVWHFKFHDGSYFLQGTIINGVIFGVITDVQNNQVLLPKDFSIQAYPNPFNSTVTLNINLPNSGFTDLSIYNILGQKITTLIEEFKNSGTYSIKYSEGKLSSGVYIVILKQNKLIKIEKIMLLK